MRSSLLSIIAGIELSHPFMSEVLKAFPDDPRGHSCLILGFTKKGRPIHIVCAPKNEFLVVVTAYEPSLNMWTPDLKTRRKI